MVALNKDWFTQKDLEWSIKQKIQITKDQKFDSYYFKNTNKMG